MRESTLARNRQVQGKRRTREHVIADLSVNHVERQALLCGHVMEERVRDYGIDLVLITFDGSGVMEPGHVLLQVKATDHLKVVHSGRLIAQRVERRDLVSWLRQPMPVILVVYDAAADVAYWLYVQAHLARKSRPNPTKGGGLVTVHVPRGNVLNPEAVRRFARFRDQVLTQTAGRIHHHE
jgi:hypothetical protein